MGLAKIDEAKCADNDRVHVLPDGADFEKYVCTTCSPDAIREIVVDNRATSPEHREELRETWREKQGDADVMAEELRSSKTAYGSRIAEAILKGPAPETVSDLFDGIRSDLKIQGKM